MDILVIYTTLSRKDRKNLTDHLYSFKRYVDGHRFYYLDTYKPQVASRLVQRAAFDGVIFHYTFLSNRYNQQLWRPFYEALAPRLKALHGCKVALPQDEYHYTASLWQLFRDVQLNRIFSIAREENFNTIFPPDEVGGASCAPVLTGYIDAGSLHKTVKKLAAKTDRRDIDIGYRARRVPFEMGRQGLLKSEIVTCFEAALAGRGDITADLGNTGNAQNTFLGDDWWRFLLRCRTMPGCLGGSDLLDPDGSIIEAGRAWLAQHPDATYEQLEAMFFPDGQGRIRSHMLSPRHFECAMTKTCQVLVEDDYHGIFEPGVHYIELKRDFSNLDEVLRQIGDRDHCEKIAQRCYDDIVGDASPDNPNTYAWFANHITAYIAENRPENKQPMGAATRLALRIHCGRVHFFRRTGLSLYHLLIKGYNLVCVFLARHPRLKAFAEKVTKRHFVYNPVQ